jgi:hypothetical protein
VILKNNDVNKLLEIWVIQIDATLSSKTFNLQEEFFFSGVDALVKKERCKNIDVPIENGWHNW